MIYDYLYISMAQFERVINYLLVSLFETRRSLTRSRSEALTCNGYKVCKIKD